MMAQHTKGPWTADDANGEGAFGIFDANGDALAMLCETRKAPKSLTIYRDHPLPNDPTWVEPGDTYAHYDQHRGNAHLMAAATDLLAVAEEIVACLYERAGPDNEHLSDREVELWNAARAAIAKATPT